MDDFPGLFARDFGVKPEGQAAPMTPSPNPPGRSFNSFPSSTAFGHAGKTDSMPVFDDDVRGGGAVDGLLFNDVFGGPKKYASLESRSPTAFHYENPFNDLKAAKSSSMPLNDKPVFDEDIFNGIPGLKSSSASTTATFDDVFSSISTSSNKRQNSSSLDDLLENSGTNDTGGKKADRGQEEKNLDFDDLIPGFGPNSWLPTNRTVPESDQSQQSSTDTAAFSVMENPFAVPNLSSTPTVSSSGISVDPSEEISKVSSSGGRKADYPSVPVEVLDHLESLGSPEKSAPEMSEVWNGSNHSRSGSMNDSQSSLEKSKSDHQNKGPVDDFMNGSTFASAGRSALPLHATESGIKENLDASDDVWLTVSEIPLFTLPTNAPPPSRPPPPRPTRPNRSKSSYNPFASAADTVDEFSSFTNSTQHFESRRSVHASERSPTTSQLDELEDFALGRTQSTGNEFPDDSFCGDLETNSASAAAAAMKEAMEKAEAKFRHAREMRGRENLKPARSKEGLRLESDDLLETDRKEKQERLDHERQQKQKEEEEKEQRRRGIERRDQDEKELEQIRFEKERVERERALARQAVERATREARERAAAQARAKAEKAAVEKASAEARERAGKAAVQRVKAEARERAAAEAKEKAAKAVAASRQRENADARARADRAAVERAAAEARARAAVAAREKAAAQARASSTANIGDDLSSIFGASPSPSGLFQEVEGESEERRRARLERDKRTKERAEKALAEKNERDLQAQREQAERHRNAETLDAEIRRWSAGKEGNLRALLSTLQYVLWPECGWQPVSLTDLITAASVKKVYRKATLCIHPDKVQQKGADIKQKYIAEKVFDLLKEAWNKLNSEELI